MKKLLLLLVTTLFLLPGEAVAQKTSVIVPGKGGIDAEKLKDKINLNIDVSKLNVNEIRVLRSAFEARQGRWLMPAELRGVFDATSWYNELACSKDYLEYDAEKEETVDKFKLEVTPAEAEFIKKLDAAEKILLEKNLVKTRDGVKPNLDNLANPMQLTEMPQHLSNALSNYGFAIVPDNKNQLFQVYENNDYHCFPSFVTTDLYMQTYHMYFDCMLRRMEETKMYGIVKQYSLDLYNEMRSIAQAAGTKQPEVRYVAERNAAFFAIAYALATGEEMMPLDPEFVEMARQEVDNVMAAKTEKSIYLGYIEPAFAYDIYRPRGHYTRSETLQRYFRCMMWLQNAPFSSDKKWQLESALMVAHVIGSNPDYAKTYKMIEEPITFLLGSPDNVSLMQVYDIIKQNGASVEALVTDPTVLTAIKEQVEALDEQQTRIRPKFERSSHCKLNLFPQRYMPDSEVLQEMVDYDNTPTKRAVPKGLDILAAMRVAGAEQLLLNELKEGEKWEKYGSNLERMKGVLDKVDWSSTVSNQWMLSLKAACEKSDNMPYFMLTPQWDKKNLNTALASWAELKHDAILYAKQPMGAECGGGDVPSPIVAGYVEPNIAYWQKAIELLDATHSVLSKYGLLNSEMCALTNQLRDNAEFFLNVSLKELNGEELEEAEYEKIKIVGSDFEYLTLQLLGVTPDSSVGWDEQVSGTDKNMAVIADVYTANADNNPKKSVLYEAVGPAHVIYVVVSIGKYLYLTRGAVFSYREFQEDIAAPRTTDEEWQQQLQVQPDMGIPDWMKEIIVPLDASKSLDNEHMFYSSGC